MARMQKSTKALRVLGNSIEMVDTTLIILNILKKKKKNFLHKA